MRERVASAARQGEAAHRRRPQDIRAGALGPGARPTETEPAARPAIGRAPVREALRRPEADGPVTRAPRVGAMCGHRAIAGGGTDVRDVPSLAARTASRRNPVIREPHTRLRDRGRPAKAALVAAIRTRLAIRNATIRGATPRRNA